jgi:uncharacterized membrane protein YgcG
MRSSFGSLSVVPWILFAQMSWDMSAVPVITAAPPRTKVTAEVRDTGGMFSRVAEQRAREALREIRRDHRIPVLIETIRSLGGEAIDDAARRKARQLRADGIYILVAVQERDVAVVLGRDKTDGRPSNPDRAALREAFLGPFRTGDGDGGLERGVRAIGTTLADAAASKPKSAGWGALITVATLMVLLAMLSAIRVGASRKGKRRRHRRASSYASSDCDAVLLSEG